MSAAQAPPRPRTATPTSKPFEFLLDRLYFWIVDGDAHAFRSNAVELLRTRRKRPRRRFAVKRNEIVPLHVGPKLRRQHPIGSGEYFDRS